MPIKAPYPHVDLPEKDIFSFLFRRSDRAFPAEHVIYQDAQTNHSYSVADVEEKAVDFGKGLKALYEWRKNHVLALFTPNHLDIAPVTFGTLWAGGILSPANPTYTVPELAQQLRNSGACLIATQLDLLDKVKAACAEAGLSSDRIILLGDKQDPSGRVKHWRNVRNISGTQRYRQAKINPKSDVAFLVYSSGTTGKPKGVRLSHYNLTSNVIQVQWSEQFNLTWDGSKTSSDIPLPSGGDKTLACLPFFHIYGLTMFVVKPMYTGVTTIIMPKFDIESWCSLVQQHRITYSYIVPPIAVQLSRHPAVSSYDLSSIRMTNSGAAPLSKELIAAVHKRTGIRIKQGYGLSETSPGVFHQRWDEWLSGAGSVGWLLPNMEAKFCPAVEDEATTITDNAEELPIGETGELYVRGPNVFLGYHNNEAATAQCLSPTGWFRTGDIGFIDSSNNLHITDRAKELIKYNGFQVAPAVLEAMLLQLPEVGDCAVVGVNSSLLQTEVPRAYVVPQQRSIESMTAEDGAKIEQWINQRVAPHEKLRGGVRFVDSIPKNASGKILRRVLREQAKQEDEVRGNAPKARL